MHNLTANLNRLALYLAYKAGYLAWGQLPLTTQVACVRASAAASYAAYVPTIAPQHAAWCTATTVATGGKLTGMVPTVQPTPAMLAATAAYRKAG